MPADFIFKLFMALSIINLVASWWFGLAMLANNSSPDYFRWELEAQRRSIHRRIWDPFYRLQRVVQMDGENSIYTHCFYGYALVSMHVGHPQVPRTEVLAELEQLIDMANKARLQKPFSFPGYQALQPAGGVIPTGNANLLRAGYILLGGANKDIIKDFHAQSKELFDSYAVAPVPFLQSAPEHIWPNDNCAALESLRLHDKLYGTSYNTACATAQKWLQTHLDPENGMMNIQIHKSGLRLDVPRGCGLTWSLAYMPGFAPELAKQQYALLRNKWFVPVLGMYGIREWWPGQQDKSTIWAGPVVFDIGWAASGIGIAAAHANGDLEGWLGLLRGLELLGFPNINIYGEKSYVGDLFLMADVAALWAKTACAWDKPISEDGLWQLPPYSVNQQSGLFAWVILGAVIFGALVAWCLIREALASWKVLRDSLPISGWTRRQKIFLVVQTALALGVFLTPVFIWPELVFAMLLLKFVENPPISRKRRTLD